MRWSKRRAFTLILDKALFGRDAEGCGRGNRGYGSCGSSSLNLLGRHGVWQIWNSRRGVGEVQACISWLSFQTHHTRIISPGCHFGCGEWPQPNALLSVWISDLRDPLPPSPHAHPLELRGFRRRRKRAPPLSNLEIRKRRNWALSLGNRGGTLFRWNFLDRP